jgi:hypothetical protein
MLASFRIQPTVVASTLIMEIAAALQGTLLTR